METINRNGLSDEENILKDASGIVDPRNFEDANPIKEEPKEFDIRKHRDFKSFYDSTQKRNYWLLGYFGGGSINIMEAHYVACQMAADLNLPLDTIRIDEIFRSTRFKGFKIMYSMAPNQEIDKLCRHTSSNVFQWLAD